MDVFFFLQAEGKSASVSPSNNDDSDPDDLGYFEPMDSSDSDVEPDSSENKEVSLTADRVQVRQWKSKVVECKNGIAGMEVLVILVSFYM